MRNAIAPNGVHCISSRLRDCIDQGRRMNHPNPQNIVPPRTGSSDTADAPPSDWSRLGRPGMFQPRPIIIRTFWPEARVLGRGQLVGQDGPRWVVLTDFPLDIGLGLTVGQVMEDLGTLTHSICEVQTCHAGQRPEDAGKDVFISRLICRRDDL